MKLAFTPADFALIGVVTAMATAMAYVHSPRAKSVVFCLPLPFTAAVISSGQSVDLTHLVGLLLVLLFPWLVWLLHVRMRVNIFVADLIGVGAFLALGFLFARLLPRGGQEREALLFAGGCVVLTVLSAAGLLLPPRIEPGHRSALPVYFKVPAVVAVVTGIILIKEPLRGFMPFFPFATIFAVYESRHSLHTLASRMPIMGLGSVPFLAIVRALQPEHGYAWALGAAWACYVPLALLLDQYYARRAVDGVDLVDAVDKRG
ncbi:MAG TPA: hypothetical protein PK280_16000 [Planctomycetota bacterium]|nr:hypothetical protein [Planctomycetota bacterium]